MVIPGFRLAILLRHANFRHDGQRKSCNWVQSLRTLIRPPHESHEFFDNGRVYCFKLLCTHLFLIIRAGGLP